MQPQFKKVFTFLASMVHQEVYYSDKPLLTKWRGRVSAFKETLLAKIKKYADEPSGYLAVYFLNLTSFGVIASRCHLAIVDSKCTYKRYHG